MYRERERDTHTYMHAYIHTCTKRSPAQACFPEIITPGRPDLLCCIEQPRAQLATCEEAMACGHLPAKFKNAYSYHIYKPAD